MLVAIVVATVIAAIKLDDPWRALLIAAGVALAIAEATAVGPRIADGLLWLAAQLLPADGRPTYLQMWRADLTESVDGQGPISFALDVLLSGPLTAIAMRQSKQSKLPDRPDMFDSLWATLTMEFFLPFGLGIGLLFGPDVPLSSAVAVLGSTLIWNFLRDVTRPGRLLVQLGAMVVAVTSLQLPSYSAVAYGGWAFASLLTVLALKSWFGWSVPRAVLLASVVAIPVSLFGALRWDYFGHDLAEFLTCMVVTPMFFMFGRVVTVVGSAPFLKRRDRVIYVLFTASWSLGTGAVLGSALSSFGLMCLSSLLFLAVGVVRELRRSASATSSPTEAASANSAATPLA